MARSLVLPACLAIIFMYVYETSEYNFTASPEDRKELFKRYQLKMKELKTPKGKLSKILNCAGKHTVNLPISVFFPCIVLSYVYCVTATGSVMQPNRTLRSRPKPDYREI